MEFCNVLECFILIHPNEFELVVLHVSLLLSIMIHWELKEFSTSLKACCVNSPIYCKQPENFSGYAHSPTHLVKTMNSDSFQHPESDIHTRIRPLIICKNIIVSDIVLYIYGQ